MKKKLAADLGYPGLVDTLGRLIIEARRSSARAVNAVMTATYWQVGRSIVNFEQRGERRAAYGEELIKRLAGDLTKRFGRGFSPRNLAQMRLFFLEWPISQISSAKSPFPILQNSSAKSSGGEIAPVETPAFPLPWSHYVRLLSVKNPDARRFYEAEALRCGWTWPQLDRQISTVFYERTALSKNKLAMMTKGAKARLEDHVTADEEVKDPFMLEFLNLTAAGMTTHAQAQPSMGWRDGCRSGTDAAAAIIILFCGTLSNGWGQLQWSHSDSQEWAHETT